MSNRSDVMSMLIDRRERSLRGLVEVSSRCVGAVNVDVADAVEAEERMADLRHYDALIESLSSPLPQYASPYRRDAGVSFLADIAQADNDNHARQRLSAHARVSARANLGATTSGQGAEFVPPLWLMAETVPAARAGRPFLNALTSQPLPAHSVSLNVPRVVSGTTAASHVDGATPTAGSESTSALSATVTEIVVRVGASLQWLELSGPGADAMILTELIGAAENEADRLAVAGSGTSGEPLGILTAALASGTTTTFSGTTGAQFVAKLGAAASSAAVARNLAATHALLHPRRAAWLGSIGTADLAAALGLLELQRISDGNIASNLGTGTDEDRVIVFRAADVLLFESDPGVNVATTSSSGGTLSVNITVRKRYATILKYPSALSVMAGTGLNIVAT